MAFTWLNPPVRTIQGGQGREGRGRRAARGPRTRGQARSCQSVQASFTCDYRATFKPASGTAACETNEQSREKRKDKQTNKKEAGTVGGVGLMWQASGQGERDSRPQGQARRAALAPVPREKEAHREAETESKPTKAMHLRLRALH